jgi:cell division transport system ATP-binding protein
MALIEFEKVSKEYEPGSKVLDEVTFGIDGGEFVFLVGPSGAGKSTIVRLMIREERPNGGDILFEGSSIYAVEKDKLSDFRRKIGVVFQDYKLLDSKNVYDNVAVALEVIDATEQEIKNIVPNVLAMVGLADKMSKFPKQLSGGEKQRVSIARALAHEPDVLIADEATGMIDPDATEEIVDILEKINLLGTTVVMCTHDQKIVDRLKKRVIRIENGKLISDRKGGKYRG